VIEYTLTAVVSKAKTRDAVVLTDTLGAGLEFGAMTDNSAGAVLGGSGATRTFTLPAGKTPGTYTVKYTAVVKANATTTGLKNSVVPTWQTTPGNNNPPNIGSLACTSAGSCETAHTMGAPDVSVAKTTTAQKARIGDEVDYQVVVTVKDAATTTAVTLTDTMGTGLEFVAGSASGPVSVTAVGASTLQLGLPAGTVPGTYRVQYRAKVTSAAAVAVTNGIVITGGGGDPTPTCAPACTTSTPLVTSNIKYAKTVNTTGPTKVGDVLTYTVQIDIADAPTTQAIEVDDELGAGLDFVASLPSSAWAVTGPVAGKLKAVIPANTPVGSYKLIYTVKVLATAQGMLTNKVSMDYNPPGGANPPSCANSCATQTPLADPVIKISKQANTAGPVTVSAASPATIRYTVTVKVENAALPAAQSQLVDNLGTGLILNGAVTLPSPPAVPAAWNAFIAGNKTLLVTIPAGTVPGVYTITYDALVTVDAIGQVVNHVNGAPTTGGVTPVCDGPCTVTIPVLRAIDAVDDDYTSTTVKGSVGTSYLGNAYRNDTLNGQPVTLQTITGKVDKVEVCTSLSPIAGCSTPTAPVPVMEAATGMVSVPPGTPMGDYLISYTICDQLQPSLCDSAVVKIKVGATITAIDDGIYHVTRGSGKELEVGNAYDNDTLDGWPFKPDLVNTTVQLYDPAGAVPGLDPVTGKIKVPPATPAGEYQIPYRICDKLNPTNCANAVIRVVVTGDASQLRIVKSAAVRTVKIGDLVRYTLKVENVGTTNVVNATLLDTAAPGLTYVAGSLQSSGLGSAVAASGVRPVQFTGITLDMGQTGTLAYLVRVGAGTQQGALVNKALARNALEETISNIATATVQLTEDPLLDHSLIFGTVFDDRDGDGWQDSAVLSGLKAQGGFAPGAYVPGSTTLDRGQGAQPVADASAPLLHGLALGEIAARQSDADPVEKHQLVIRQKLRRLDFTDDFVLSNDQGVTVRMDAAGQTTVTQSGEAAAGRNAAAVDVQRRISATEGGHYVDYVIRSTGVDERGIPGVRIAAVEGLLMETDPFGRFHLVDVQGGAWERGRNFILKVDPSTLPAGAEFTTSNPLLRRITPGLPVRFDFGVKLQPQRIEGGQRWIEIELGSVLFAPGDARVQAAYLPVIAKVADKLQQYGGGELLVQADGEGQALAFARAEAVRAALLKPLPEAVAQATQVSVRTKVDDADGLVSGVTAQGAVLGTVLFETDKAVVRPAYQELLAKVAAYLTRQGGGVVHITGHTDVRASHAYNQKLGLQRA
ncbi:MAG: OmpA family protein, partial [Comamonas sp.]